MCRIYLFGVEIGNTTNDHASDSDNKPDQAGAAPFELKSRGRGAEYARARTPPTARTSTNQQNNGPTPQSQSSSRNHHYEVCCPVWAYAMQQLDLRQQQARYLQSCYDAAASAAAASTDNQRSKAHSISSGGRSSRSGESDQQPTVIETSSSSNSDVALNLLSSSSKSSASGRNHSTTSVELPSAAISAAGAGSRTKPISGAGKEFAERDKKTKKKKNTTNKNNDQVNKQFRDELEHQLGGELNSSSSHLQPAADEKIKPSAKLVAFEEPPSSRDHESSATRKQEKEEAGRMKRFSSALCLHDSPPDESFQKSSGSGSASAARKQQHQVKQEKQPSAAACDSSINPTNNNNTNNKKRSSGSSKPDQASTARINATGAVEQQQTIGCHKLSSKNNNNSSLLLQPQDPIFLARQRRPSASNQGSLSVDQQALFSAVECNQLERARSILEERKVNVNSLNCDKLTCLDIAVLMRNFEMVRLLQQHNAKESMPYLSREARANQLYSLYTEAKRLVEDLARSLEAISTANKRNEHSSSSSSHHPPSPHSECISTSAAAAGAGANANSCEFTSSSAATADERKSLTASCQQPHSSAQQMMLATGSLLSSALFEEKQGQLQYWRRRLHLFMHMRYEFEQLQIPTPPELIVLQVTGENSLAVKIVHSLAPQSQQQQQQKTLLKDHYHNYECFNGSNMMMINSQVQYDQVNPRKATNQQVQVNMTSGEAQMDDNIQLEEALARCTDPRCTHWRLLSDMNTQLVCPAAAAATAAQVQVQAAAQVKTTKKQATTRETSSGTNRKQQQPSIRLSFTPATDEVAARMSPQSIRRNNNNNKTESLRRGNGAEQQEQLEAAAAKEQKLAVFNQMIAQQLIMLSYEQQSSCLLGSSAAAAAAPIMERDHQVVGLNYNNNNNKDNDNRNKNNKKKTNSPRTTTNTTTTPTTSTLKELILTTASPAHLDHAHQHQPQPLLMAVRPTSQTRAALTGGRCGEPSNAYQLITGASRARSRRETTKILRGRANRQSSIQWGVDGSDSVGVSPADKVRSSEFASSASTLAGNSGRVELNIIPTADAGNNTRLPSIAVGVGGGRHQLMNLPGSGYSPILLGGAIGGSNNTFESNGQQVGVGGNSCYHQLTALTQQALLPRAHELMIITKYKIEWSLNERMEPIVNSMIIYNTNSYPLECCIGDLMNSKQYFIRVSAGNHKGFSESRPSTPYCLAPSSWRQVTSCDLAVVASASPGTGTGKGTGTGTGAVQVVNQVSGSNQSSSSSRQNNRRKYDEEVFRKFTKLILLNKHILDEHQLASLTLMNSQQQSSSAIGAGGATWGSGNNKSTLINMLLLDATNAGAALPGVGTTNSSSLSCSSARGSLISTEQLGAAGSSELAAAGSQQQQSSLSVRKNLKNFFQSNTFKFHKLNNHNKRGLYLTTVIYFNQHQQQRSTTSTTNFATTGTCAGAGTGTSAGSGAGDKIVITNDDRLPVIEVMNDLVSPGTLMSDFYWLLKVNGTQWMDIKRLRQQLQKSHSSSTLHLRIKLLSAIEQMQLALNMEDIGRLFYKPIQAHDGSMVICTCKRVENTKLVSSLSIKWTQQAKLIPRHLRKISDSMLQRQQEQQQQNEQLNKFPHSSAEQLAGIFPQIPMANRVKRSSDLMSTAASNNQQQQQDSSITMKNLCEFCQWNSNHNLQQRRPTIASASSSSSLASSTNSESHWSSGHYASANQQPGTAAAGKCTCGKLAGGSSGSNTTTNTGASSVTYLNTPSRSSLLTCSGGSTTTNTTGAGPMSSCSSSSTTSFTTTHTTTTSTSSIVSAVATGTGCGPYLTTPTSTLTCVGSQQQQQQLNAAPPPMSSRHSTAGSTMLLHHLSGSSGSGGGHRLSESVVSGGGGGWAPRSSSMVAPSATTGCGGQTATGGSMSHSGSVAHHGGYHGGSISFGIASSSSHSTGGGGMLLHNNATGAGRHSQPQQMTLAQQNSSTYLMLASLSLYDLLLFSLNEIIQFDRTSTIPLSRGLYLGFVQLQTTVESMRLLVPRARPNMVPCTRIRDNSHVSREEWLLLRKFGLAAAAGGAINNNNLTTSTDSARRKVADKGGGGGRFSETSSLRSLEDQQQQQQQQRGSPSGSLEPLGGRGLGGGSSAAALSVSNDEIAVTNVSELANTHDGQGYLLAQAQQSSSTTNLLQEETMSDDDEDDELEDNDEIESSFGQVGVSSNKLTSSSPELVACDNKKESGGGETSPVQEAGGGPAAVTRSVGAGSRSPTLSTRSQQVVQTMQAMLLQSPEETFVRLVGSAAARLLSELKTNLPKVYDTARNEWVSCLQSLNDVENNRIYHLELIELSSQVSFILLIPAVENVCPVTSQEKSEILSDNRDYMLLPLQIFETIHIATYEQELLARYSRLSAILETDLIVAQHDHRQAFSSNELKSTKSRVSQLQEWISIADEFWRQLRWIVDVVSFARDKSQAGNSAGPSAVSSSSITSGGGGGTGGIAGTATNNSSGATAAGGGGAVKLGSIWRYFELMPAYYSSSSSSSMLLVPHPATSSSNIIGVTAADQSITTAAAAAALAATTTHATRAQQRQQEFSATASSTNNKQQVKRTTSARSPRSTTSSSSNAATMMVAPMAAASQAFDSSDSLNDGGAGGGGKARIADSSPDVFKLTTQSPDQLDALPMKQLRRRTNEQQANLVIEGSSSCAGASTTRRRHSGLECGEPPASASALATEAGQRAPTSGSGGSLNSNDGVLVGYGGGPLQINCDKKSAYNTNSKRNKKKQEQEDEDGEGGIEHGGVRVEGDDGVEVECDSKGGLVGQHQWLGTRSLNMMMSVAPASSSHAHSMSSKPARAAEVASVAGAETQKEATSTHSSERGTTSSSAEDHFTQSAAQMHSFQCTIFAGQHSVEVEEEQVEEEVSTGASGRSQRATTTRSDHHDCRAKADSWLPTANRIFLPKVVVAPSSTTRKTTTTTSKSTSMNGKEQREEGDCEHKLITVLDRAPPCRSPVNSYELEDDDEDADAIYAYHISLKHATKRAQERKSSQQSIRAFVEEPLCVTPTWEQRIPPLPSPRQEISSLVADRVQVADSVDEWIKIEEKKLERAEEEEETGAGGGEGVETIATCNKSSTLSRLKPTNPFLSDSFDLN